MADFAITGTTSIITSSIHDHEGHKDHEEATTLKVAASKGLTRSNLRRAIRRAAKQAKLVATPPIEISDKSSEPAFTPDAPPLRNLQGVRPTHIFVGVYPPTLEQVRLEREREVRLSAAPSPALIRQKTRGRRNLSSGDEYIEESQHSNPPKKRSNMKTTSSRSKVRKGGSGPEDAKSADSIPPYKNELKRVIKEVLADVLHEELEDVSGYLAGRMEHLEHKVKTAMAQMCEDSKKTRNEVEEMRIEMGDLAQDMMDVRNDAVTAQEDFQDMALGTMEGLEECVTDLIQRAESLIGEAQATRKRVLGVAGEILAKAPPTFQTLTKVLEEANYK